MKIRGKKGHKIIFIVCLFLFTLCAVYFILFRIPIKHSVQASDLVGQTKVWIVKRVSGPPEYIVIGDGAGLFSETSVEFTSVYLDGAAPPQGFGTALNIPENVYICHMQEDSPAPSSHQGTEVFTVLSWEPLGPIYRDSILPDFFYSQNYLCIADLFLRSEHWLP